MPLDLACGEVTWGVWSVAPHLHVHFWIKERANPPASCGIVQKVREAAPTRNGWALRILSNYLVFEVWSSAGVSGVAFAAWSVTPGDWHCVDATFDSQYLHLYVDNAQVGYDAIVSQDELAAAVTSVLLSSAPYYQAEIEGLALWSAVRTADERAILYHSGKRIARAETLLIDQSSLEALLELNYDDRDYSSHGRNIDEMDHLTDGGGAYTDTLGEGGGYGAAYCPPLMPAHAAQRHCSHQDLAETIGH